MPCASTDQYSESDYPERNVEPPAREEELPGLAWRHTSKSVEQRTNQVRINRYFQKHDIELPDGSKEAGVVPHDNSEHDP